MITRFRAIRSIASSPSNNSERLNIASNIAIVVPIFQKYSFTANLNCKVIDYFTNIGSW
jgi:hypothetical protein